MAAARAEVTASLDRGGLSEAGEALRWDVPTPHRWRDDRITWVEKRQLEGRPALQAVRARITSLLEELSLTVRMKGHSESQIGVYREAARGYARHRDADPADGTEGWPDQGTGDRRMTAILYLNPGWEPCHGGRLRLWKPGGEAEDVAPRGGRLLLFLSGCVEHQVLAVGPGSAPRVAFTVWFY